MSARFFRYCLLALCIQSLSLWAQLTVSTLRGTATDQSGAVVVNARIRVVHLETNLTREVDTNENGDFELEGSAPIKKIVALIKPSDTLRPPLRKQ